MEEAAARRNADLIAAGRLSLHRGDGIHLPLPDDSLDAVLAVHNIYFWPDPPATLAEIARTLQPGGSLVLAFPAGEHPRPARLDPAIYRVPTTAEATHWLQSAGFVDIDIERRPHIAATVIWIIATAPDEHGPARRRGRCQLDRLTMQGLAQACRDLSEALDWGAAERGAVPHRWRPDVRG